jgi:hypothetical protein
VLAVGIVTEKLPDNLYFLIGILLGEQRIGGGSSIPSEELRAQQEQADFLLFESGVAMGYKSLRAFGVSWRAVCEKTGLSNSLPKNPTLPKKPISARAGIR